MSVVFVDIFVASNDLTVLDVLEQIRIVVPEVIVVRSIWTHVVRIFIQVTIPVTGRQEQRTEESDEYVEQFSHNEFDYEFI